MSHKHASVQRVGGAPNTVSRQKLIKPYRQHTAAGDILREISAAVELAIPEKACRVYLSFLKRLWLKGYVNVTLAKKGGCATY